MHDRDLTENEVAKRRTPGTDPQEAITCPVSVTPSRKMESLDAGLCAALEDAGCPVGASIRDRLAFETLLTELSSRFVNIPANRVDSQIEWGMRLVVEQLGIDRCGFGEVLGDGKQFVVTHSYQLPTVPSCFGLILQEQFPAYARMIRQGMIIRLPEDLPADAVAERQYLLQSGLISSLTIPLTVMGSVVGALGLASFRTQLA